MNKEISLISQKIGHGHYAIRLSECASDFQQMMFEHCAEMFPNRHCINDSKSNRELIQLALAAHGFADTHFLDPLPKKR